ncbi:MAG TPA: MXAN_5187 C-terminal domain-containing protein [Candidatus Acidoferrum sp.]|nr:MXAN_5187 C-terminal domain-containing protein [Candidatus Acidoferrum sp.]
MATIDEDLAQLERDIRQLKIEYDQYFGGGRKRPPNEIEWRIELLVKRYGERGGEMKSGQRFKFNGLTQSYAKYRDMFRKRTKAKEEGSVVRHYGAAARAIEAQRAQQHPEAHPEAASHAPPAVASRATETPVFRMTTSQPDAEADKVAQLYDALMNAKERAGESTGKLSRASFDEFVRKKTADLQKQQNCRDVEYVVETVDGQVKLKALVKS